MEKNRTIYTSKVPPNIPSGNQNSDGKSPCLMGKLNYQWPFSSSQTVRHYQRVNPIKSHSTIIFPWFSYGFPMTRGSPIRKIHPTLRTSVVVLAAEMLRNAGKPRGNVAYAMRVVLRNDIFMDLWIWFSHILGMIQSD